MRIFTLSAFLLMQLAGLATIRPVAVTNNQFTPANMNVVVGDTIQFNFQVGFHNVLSSVVGSATGVVPTGAADLNSGTPSGTNPRTYQYKVTTIGQYRYYCQVHSADGVNGMVGFLTATAPLPANLKSFTARYSPGAVTTNWQTLTESNVAYFAINKSLNGKDFVELGRTPAAGNSTMLQDYTYTDTRITPENAYLYYSLATVDKDGKTSLSPIVQVRNTQAVKKLITSLSPNPVPKPGHLMLQFNADGTGKLLASVYNMDGKKVLSDEMNAITGLNNGHLHVGDLQPGIYNIVFSMGKLKETYRVVVE